MGVQPKIAISLQWHMYSTLPSFLPLPYRPFRCSVVRRVARPTLLPPLKWRLTRTAAPRGSNQIGATGRTGGLSEHQE